MNISFPGINFVAYMTLVVELYAQSDNRGTIVGDIPHNSSYHR